MRIPIAVASILAWSTLAAGPAMAADKTDTVQLKNGNVLTGEIKTLERGQLTYKTDTMETVTIKWSWVTQLVSNVFLVTSMEGSALATAGRRRPRPCGSRRRRTTTTWTGRTDPQIETGFWDRIDLSLNPASATPRRQVSQFTFDGRTSYRTGFDSRKSASHHLHRDRRRQRVAETSGSSI
jgi:hypothetical protein